jgi:hypothetical protein
MSVLDLLFAFMVLAGVLGAFAYLTRFVGALSQSQRLAPDLDRKLIDLLDRKAHLVEDLRDLELDYRMGKIAVEDYDSQRARLEPQAVAVIRELETRGYRSEIDAMLEEDEETLQDDELLEEDELVEEDDLLDVLGPGDEDEEEATLLSADELRESGALKRKGDDSGEST